MSGQALRDLNVLPPSELDKKPDGSVKGKVCIGNIVENHEKKTKVPTTVSDSSLNDAGLGNDVIEAGNLEVEYIDSENLTDLQDVDACLSV